MQAGIKDPEKFKQAETILLEMGYLFQVQDDFLDFFGDSEASGKDSTDIQEGKCTWFVVMALQRATPKQRKILEVSTFGLMHFITLLYNSFFSLRRNVTDLRIRRKSIA